LQLKKVDDLMKQGIARGVFPGAVLLAARQGRISLHRAYGFADFFSRQPMTLETCFDLASLTKPLATTLAVMQLAQKNKINLDCIVGDYLPQLQNTDKALITVRHLLCHCSGLPAWRPYFLRLRRLPLDQRLAVLRRWLVAEALEKNPGTSPCYSDLGFMLVQWVVESLAVDPLNHFVVQNIYGPLGISSVFFTSTRQNFKHKAFAATELCPWRHRLLIGEVHDANAHVVGGYAGHAGLFGTAQGVYDLLQGLLAVDAGHAGHPLFSRELVQQFFERQPNNTWALGFDTPAPKGSSAGNFFSPDSVGHLGYTGTSFWMDRKRSITIILLTNRVHPLRYNTAIRAFRPNLYNAVMESLI
jgi:CubicO group peptidase (beta-lactamase class C family)